MKNADGAFNQPQIVQAFDAAQLDSNVDALYDDRGGAGDPTMAMDLLENALLSARVKVEELVSSAATMTIRSLDEASNSKGAAAAVGAAADGSTASAAALRSRWRCSRRSASPRRRCASSAASPRRRAGSPAAAVEPARRG